MQAKIKLKDGHKNNKMNTLTICNLNYLKDVVHEIQIEVQTDQLKSNFYFEFGL